MNRLAVDNDFRGMKIGRKLVQALIDLAKENGYENMYLETSGMAILIVESGAALERVPQVPRNP